ncbi:MAG TPA: metallophosphoesterase, partial [Thermotoga sp.]|nr:metallophosphoesterase [Thermotoga sp.]
MKILFFGDVVGSPGRKILRKAVEAWRSEVDFIIVNGENAAHGYGLTPKIVEEILDMGVDVITTGGHVYDRKEWKLVTENYPQVLVPANYPGQFHRGIYVS